MTKRIVSAYAAASRELSSDPEAEAKWYWALRDSELVDGLELSYTSGFHPGGSDHLTALLDPEWSLVVTSIRRTLGAGYRNPAYGLASADEAGRRAAVDDVAELRRQIAQLDRPILAVELHSAPNRGRADSSASDLKHSLEEILSWDWGGSKIVLEHCDAFRTSNHVQKGYLPLVEELDVVRDLSTQQSTNLAMALNWGRSVIEVEDVRGAQEHLALALESGLLSAFVFSGAAAVDSAFGPAWRDVHLPLAEDEPTSLLTVADIGAAVERLPLGLDYLGVKTTSHPDRQGIDRLVETFRLLAVTDQHARSAGLVTAAGS